MEESKIDPYFGITFLDLHGFVAVLYALYDTRNNHLFHYM